MTKITAEKAEKELFSIQYDVSFEGSKEHFAGKKHEPDIKNKRYTKNFYVTAAGQANAAFTESLNALKTEDNRIDGKLGNGAKKDMTDAWIKNGFVALHCPTDKTTGKKKPAVVAEADAGAGFNSNWYVAEEYFYLDGIEQDVAQPDGEISFAETDYFIGSNDIKLTKSKDETGWFKEINAYYGEGNPRYVEYFGDRGHENRGPHNLCTIYYTEKGQITTGTLRKNDKGEIVRLTAAQITEVGGVNKEEATSNGLGFIGQQNNLKVA